MALLRLHWPRMQPESACVRLFGEGIEILALEKRTEGQVQLGTYVVYLWRMNSAHRLAVVLAVRKYPEVNR